VHLMSLLGYPEAIKVSIQYSSPRNLCDDDGHDDVSLNCNAILFVVEFY
jgi:hypothetical protein